MTIKPIAFIGLLLLACLSFTRCGSQTTAQSPTAESESIEKESIVAVLRENSELPIGERIALFYKLKEENPNGYDFDNEADLNIYGYGLLWDNNVIDAIEVFKLVVAEFPESANAYDSLGEAYLANGNKELSLLNYEKSLALNPDNFGAEDQVHALKNPDWKPPTPAELFVKLYTAAEYKADLDQLGNTLTEIHPAVFKFISEKDFWQNIEDQKTKITDQTTYAEFSWICSDIIASINCSHSGMGWFYPQYNMLPVDRRFPIQTRFVEGKLYVIDPLNNDKKVKLKDEIESINGTPVSSIITEIYKHISSQGHIETTKRQIFNHWSTGMIAFALDFPESYTVSVKGQDKPIALNKAESTKDPLPDNSIVRCEGDLCLDFLDKETAVLTISSFNYYPNGKLDVFKKFVDDSFIQINEKNPENLIIDLRFNGGGSPESALYLLRHISDKPFIYFSNSAYGAPEFREEVAPFDKAFTGKSYFIIDGFGNSTTGHFMSMVKMLDLGPIVGEELGSNQFCTGGGTPCRLKNTKLNYHLGDNINETSATDLPDEVGILPDYNVIQDIDAYLANKDVVKEFTIGLTK